MISTVMETVQVTETIMVPQQITKTIQVPKQVTSTVTYGAEGAGSTQAEPTPDHNHHEAILENKPQGTPPVSPAPAWLLREEEITCIYDEMDRQVHVVILTCNRTNT